jgi:adrenodoxin-NADP+ reductase
MLLTPPTVLEKYDVPASVLEVLHRSAVRHVSIIGRRGPLQAAFTTKELRELTSLTSVSMIPLAPELLAQPPASTKLSRQQTRLLQLLQQGSLATTQAPPPATGTKSWSLDFFRSPTGLEVHGQHLTLSLAHTALDEHSRAVPTGATSALRTDLVVTSLGQHADPSAVYYDPVMGHLRTDRGRVLDDAGRALRRVYASGWAATGARGVLAATMMDAYAVADTILTDYHDDGRSGVDVPPVNEVYSDDAFVADSVDLESVPGEIDEGVKGRRIVQYDQWKKIDAEEMRRGAATGKERERMGWEEAYEFLTSAGAWQS